MAHIVRVLDLDPGNLMILEPRVKKAVRKAGIKAHVSMVSDNLAITRQGLMDSMPVLEINGTIVSKSKPLLPKDLDAIFSALA